MKIYRENRTIELSWLMSPNINQTNRLVIGKSFAYKVKAHDIILSERVTVGCVKINLHSKVL